MTQPADAGTGLPRLVLLEPNDGCLTIAQRLATRGVEVVALCPPASAWVGRSRALREIAVGQVPDGADRPWLPALAALGDRPGVLVCGSDAASEFVVAHRREIPSVLRSFETVDGAHLVLMQKDTMRAVAEEAGVRVPHTFRIDGPGDDRLVELAAAAAPCVAKPVLGHVGRRSGDFATRLLPDADAVRAHLDAALAAGVDMLVSEEIPGPATALEGVISLRTADGTYQLEAGRRKIRHYDHGVGSLVEAAAVPEAVALARRLLEAAGYVGLAATEFKRHAVTGELYLIEINVRVPQYFGVYDAAGLDASWRLYATLAGLPVAEQPPVREGRRVWMPQHDLRVIRELRRRDEITAAQAVRSLAGVRDAGVLSWRDPAPAWAVLRAEWGRLRRR
jgi:predicted ATP-grasp superfamily ATP-dependent carboligase